MKNQKTTIIVVALLAVLLAALGGFFLLRGGEDAPENINQAEGSSSYITWSQAAFEQNADQERWLYFHAEWCPECRALEADIKANLSEIPAGVVIFKIEYDDHQDLRQRWQVLRRTTVVSVDAQGEKVQEVLAVGSKNNLAGVIDALYVQPADTSEDGDNDEAGDEGDADSTDASSAVDEVRQTIRDGLAGNEDAVDDSGQYIEWSEEAFEANSDQQRWLYFHAEWCPECRALEADIKANLSDIPAGVIIFKIEYDDHQDLRQRWQVLSQTTVISVDTQGEKVQEVLAVGSKNNLAAVIGALE